MFGHQNSSYCLTITSSEKLNLQVDKSVQILKTKVVLINFTPKCVKLDAENGDYTK